MGVDAGGDAFALAQEQYGQPVEGSLTIGVGGLVDRYAAQAKRYELAIENQKAIITTQGKRITEALTVLEEMDALGDGTFPLVRKAIAALKGESDG